MNSKKAYKKNIKDVTNHMISVGLQPTLDNVTYEYCQVWKNAQAEKVKPSTLRQQKSTLSSLFRHLNHAKIIEGNPFLTVKITDYTEQQYLSKELDLIELYQVYKAAHELQAQGINVLAPTLLDIFAGFRSTNLISLQAQSVDKEAGGIRIILSNLNHGEVERKKGEKTTNSKNRESFIPLPPRVLAYFVEYTKDMNPEDPLLYGLRGKAFANKQMNYIVHKICKHLGWVTAVTPSEVEDGNKGTASGKHTMQHKTSKYFTPHGLRYSVATMFHEMGVSDNAIRLLLLHSKKASQGALERYLRRDTKEVKELRMAQTILETVLQAAFQAQMNNIYSVHTFKQQMIRFTMAEVEQKLSQPMMIPNQQVMFQEFNPHTTQSNQFVPNTYIQPSNQLVPTQNQMNFQSNAPVPMQMNFYGNQQDITGISPAHIASELLVQPKR
ncbi:tyrosine-type recombinase/integrase [Peribacillus sp. NPDC097295]|uniref:tyrosine-type recombinase/integrase n=1 Tax=Peribacillus sp. NPDC097295 TaxID=3364402 RepID=UPI00382811F4